MTENKPREERLQTIIEAAVEEFLKKGFEGTSMASIAKRAGLTKGGLYHHFSSKDEILITANEYFTRPVEAFMTNALQRKSAMEGLAYFIDAYLCHWEAHPKELAFVYLTMTKVLSNPEYAASFEDYGQQMSEILERLLTTAMASGELRAHDAHARAKALAAALDGVTLYIVAQSEPTAKAVACEFKTVFLDDIASQKK